jgi:ribonuclease BN (tRNA processing enzyme)
MASVHAHLPLRKRIRQPSRRIWLMVGIALGCGIGTHAAAQFAPQLGTPTSAHLPAPALANVATPASATLATPASATLATPASTADAAPTSANADSPAPASGRARTGPLVGCGPRGVTLQVLGSGGPELQDKRASSSYLVWRAGVPRVLVDSGGGSALRFGESGATMSDLDVILLTHLHVDHTADLAALVKSSFFEDRHRKLPLFGPDGNQFFPSTTRFVQTLFASSDGAYRYLGDFLNPNATGSYLLEPHNVTPAEHEVRQIYDAEGIRVFATTVVHGSVPALAYRIDLDNVSIAFTGDTDGNNGNLERLAHNANLLVAHNAVPEGATGVERSLHMPPSVIGKIASTASVRQLVLSHRMLRTLGHETESLAAIHTSYTGSVTFADDLQCFHVSR